MGLPRKAHPNLMFMIRRPNNLEQFWDIFITTFLPPARVPNLQRKAVQDKPYADPKFGKPVWTCLPDILHTNVAALDLLRY